MNKKHCIDLNYIIACWNSTVDPSWKQGLSRLHPELLIHYQRLPQGSPSKKATRINIRVDAPPISASMSALQKIQWQVWSDSGKSPKKSTLLPSLRLYCKSKLGAESVWFMESFSCYTICCYCSFSRIGNKCLTIVFVS